MSAKVYLKRAKDGELVQATLCDQITQNHLDQWETTWIPEMKAFAKQRSSASGPEDAHWDWRGKVGKGATFLSHCSFALESNGNLQGMMMANTVVSARLPEQFGKPLVYIEYLATAPWNRPETSNPSRLRGIGSAFVLTAIELSIDEGFKGRVGLHSLSEAEDFYEVKCGMTRLGPDGAHQDLTYFELTETQAESFRRNI